MKLNKLFDFIDLSHIIVFSEVTHYFWFTPKRKALAFYYTLQIQASIHLGAFFEIYRIDDKLFLWAENLLIEWSRAMLRFAFKFSASGLLISSITRQKMMKLSVVGNVDYF